MPEVRCPCGCVNEVAAAQVGQAVRCRGCRAQFVAGSVEVELAESRGAVATDAPEPKARDAPRLGDLAVERALVSREHIELCFQVQQALREAGEGGKRIGDILVEKGLLTRDQLEDLLSVQAGVVREEAEERPKPVARPKAPARPAERAEAEPVPARVRRAMLRPTTLVLLATLLLVFAAIELWPAPAPQRTLVAYLESSREGALQPDLSLALGDLGLRVREFRVERLLARARHDYAPEIRVFRSRRDQGTWEDLQQVVEMSTDKRGVLALVAPVLPEALTPHDTDTLTVSVQPITCHLLATLPGEALFKEGRYRFTVVRVDSRRWSSGWRVAACVPAQAESPD